MLFLDKGYAHSISNMPMQTRSMTARAGVPHDLEAFNSYAEDAFEFHLPPKKRQRFLDWDEDSDDDSYSFISGPTTVSHDSQATIVDDEEDSFETATGSSESDFDPLEPPQMPTYDEVPEEIKAAYDPDHFCPSWVKCCEENLAAKSAARSKATNSVLGPRQYAEASASCSAAPVAEPASGDWSIPIGLNIATLPPLPRWPEMLATFRTRFTRSQWRDYIGEICHNISYKDKDCSELTTEEYAATRDFMHGNL